MLITLYCGRVFDTDDYQVSHNFKPWRVNTNVFNEIMLYEIKNLINDKYFTCTSHRLFPILLTNYKSYNQYKVII